MTVIAVALIGVLAATWSFHRPRMLRVAGGPDPTADVLAISVIIPSRDEAGNLGTLLRSLACCVPAPAQVIVIDDSSTDGTGELARSFGVTVLDADPLPDGWIGKSWACHIGAVAATQPTLVFLDADTELEPGALLALGQLHAQCGGLVSVQPFHVVPSTSEQCSAFFNLVSVMSSGAFGWSPPRQVRLAFGPCLVTSRDDYWHVGGHAATGGDIVEDIALAERYADEVLPVTCALGGDQIRFRMYPDGLRSLVTGWTKNIAIGARRGPRARTLVTVVWIVAMCTVASSVMAGLVMWPVGRGAPVAALIAWMVVAIDLGWKLRKIGSFRWTSAVFFMVPLSVFVVVFVRSLALSVARRPVHWRGRAIQQPPPRSAR